MALSGCWNRLSSPAPAMRTCSSPIWRTVSAPRIVSARFQIRPCRLSIALVPISRAVHTESCCSSGANIDVAARMSWASGSGMARSWYSVGRCGLAMAVSWSPTNIPTGFQSLATSEIP